VTEEEGQHPSHHQTPSDDAPPGDWRPMKACPDCAELVLAAARKCRYCGYEFAPAPAPAYAGSNSGLFGLLRRPAQRLTMTETLTQLGIDLDRGEQPAGLWLARAYSTDGYVVLTSTRLFFAPGLRRPANAPAPRQHSLDELAGAEIAGRRFKSALVLHWHDSPDLSIDGLAPKDLRQLHAALLSRVRG
jgi:hypothetical protein